MSLGGLSLSQLWPLLLGLPAILLLILLERQRRRPVLITIASLALLPPAQPGATKPRARRADLDMLLLILGTGALALACCGPVFDRSRPAAPRLVLLLDRGVSLSADGGARLDRLRDKLRPALTGLPASSRLRLVTSPPSPGLLQEGSPREVLAAIDRLKASSQPSRCVEVLAELAAAESAAALILASDRERTLPSWLGPRVVQILQGQALPNLGLVAAGCRQSGQGKTLLQLSLSGMTAGGEQPQLLLSPGGASLPAGMAQKTIPLQLEGPGPAGTWWTARAELDPAWRSLSVRLAGPNGGPWNDALPADDAILLERKARPLAVQLTGRISPELRRALKSVPGLRLGAGEGADLRVHQGPLTEQISPPALVFIPPAKGEALVTESRGSLSSGFLPSLPADHPRIARARPAPPAALGVLRPLITDEAGRVLGGWSGQGSQSLVYFGFEPSAKVTDWVSQPSFPLLVAGLTSLLSDSDQPVLRAGLLHPESSRLPSVSRNDPLLSGAPGVELRRLEFAPFLGLFALLCLALRGLRLALPKQATRKPPSLTSRAV